MSRVFEVTAPTVLGAMVVLGAALTGCGLVSQTPTPQPRAAAFFEPVGQLALLKHRSPPEAAAPAAVSYSRNRRGVRQVPDSKLRLDVGMKLEASALDLGEVGFSVDSQTVELTGRVPTLEARDRAELLARSVDGIAAVRNEIRVDAVADAASE